MTPAAPPWITRLLRILAAGDPTARLAETHISWVLLAGGFAYKIKKPLKLPFLDFSTLALRREACNDELRLNKRFAAELYLEVLPIAGTPEAPLPGGSGAPFEYAVRMKRFDSAQQLDHLVEQDGLGAAELREFGEALAGMHASLSCVPPDASFGTPDAVLGDMLDCLRDLRQPPADANLRQGCDELEERLLGHGSPGLRAALSDRRALHVRECHGDLHLGNLVRLERGVVPFDCIEFSARLRWIDIISDVAFLVMDLCQRNQAPLAYAFLNSYLESGGDYPGVRVLRPYLAYRALVRARVALIRRRSAPADELGLRECHSYMEQALRWARPSHPVLVLMHGLSGSGKTRCSSELMCRLPAIRLRSDVERKRMHGLAASDSSGSTVAGGIYTAEASQALYVRLETLAGVILEAGESAIVDAAFLDAGERRRFAGLAERLGVPLVIVSCSAPQAELERRLAQRWAAGADASEADLAVLRQQLVRQEPLDFTELERTVKVDTARPELEPPVLARVNALAGCDTSIRPVP